MTRRPSASVVLHLDGLAAGMDSTSPIFMAVPDGMLSVHIKWPAVVVWQPSARMADMAPRDRRGARHVMLHQQVHGIAWLQVDPTRVVHDALAHHGQVATRGAVTRAIRELDHARLFGAAGVDAGSPPQPSSSNARRGRTPRSPGRGWRRHRWPRQPSARLSITRRRIAKVTRKHRCLGHHAPLFGALRTASARSLPTTSVSRAAA
jgi:hypothetical protein